MKLWNMAPAWTEPCMYNLGHYRSNAANPQLKSLWRIAMISYEEYLYNPQIHHNGDLIMIWLWLEQNKREEEMKHRVNLMAMDKAEFLVEQRHTACRDVRYKVHDKFNYKKLRLMKNREFLFN